jgi:ADP-ribose pyrophosphatase YjhB (NUDIX family)
MSPIITTLVYCVRNDEVLLVRRSKEPFKGHWTAPGGKREPGESPRECAARELLEETGLLARDLRLRGVLVETSPRPDWQWLMFAYVVKQFEGNVASDTLVREGLLRWVKIGAYDDLLLPAADAVFMPRVLSEGDGVYEAHFVYDGEKKITAVHEYLV